MKTLSNVLTTGVLALAGTAASVLLFAPQAKAALLFSDSDSFTNALTELTGAPQLTVIQFAIPVGFTNLSATITLSATLRSSGTVTNNAAQAQSFTALVQKQVFTLTPSAGPSGLNTLRPFGADFSAQTIGSQSFTNLASGATANFNNAGNPYTISGSDSQTVAGTGLFGNGVITFDPVTLIGTTFLGGGGNVGNQIQTFADATLTIEYFGDPVPTNIPEPGTVVGILTVAGAGLLSCRRKS